MSPIATGEAATSTGKAATPEWVRRGVLYHIYPLSFADSNGDGYGDLQGIINHLDYLGELGVTAIWLSPVYRSPMADYGYDVADHTQIDPRFGTMRDMDELIREVHAREMKILLDYVPNHTSIEHEWFKESRSSNYNKKRDWYIWADPKPDGAPPNNWLSRFGGSAWEWDEATHQYYLHSYLVEQPDLNWRNPEVRQAMLDVLRFWLDRGVDGFRTDAVLSIAKDPLLRDDPPNPAFIPGQDDPAHAFITTYSRGYRSLNELLEPVCSVLAKKTDTFLISEAYINIPGLMNLYDACREHPLHAPLNFNLMSLSWNAQAFCDFIETYQEALGEEDWPNYVLGNHDRHRLASRLGPDRARLLAMLQLTLRGLPVIYYGDELGLTDAVVSKARELDNWGKLVPGYGFGRDPERAPMPWNSSSYAGFSSHQPWLPLASGYRSHNVASQKSETDSSLRLYRALIKLRSASPVLQEGTYQTIRTYNAKVYAYARRYQNQELVIALNFSRHPQEFNLHQSNLVPLVSSRSVTRLRLHDSAGAYRLQGYEGMVYRKGGNQ